MNAHATHCRDCGDELLDSVEKARGYCHGCDGGTLKK